MNTTQPHEPTLGGVALLIGVEHYRDYDREGKHDLLAGRNDVLAYWKVCRRLGYPVENIRVLTTPKLTYQDILWAEKELAPELYAHEREEDVEARVKGWFASEPKVYLAKAEQKEILDGVAWLAERLVITVKLGWGIGSVDTEVAGLPGFFAYSGHGAQRDGELVLCPSDTGRQLQKTISFEELRRLFDQGDDVKAEGTLHPTDNLTVVLDCCFAASGPIQKSQRVPFLPSGASSPRRASITKSEIGSRMFCASGPDAESYQAMLGGYWYSAFTWAFTVALEQWMIEPKGTHAQSTISHAELLFRARTLMRALSFRQHPMLVDRAGIGNLPVFFHDAQAQRDETSATPNAARFGGQIDPSDRGFAYYELRGDDRVLARIIATNTTAGDLEARMEYWQVVGSRLHSNDHLGLTLVKTVHEAGEAPPFTREQASFSCGVDARWVNQTVTGSYQMMHRDGFKLEIDYVDGRWVGSLAWVRALNVTGHLFAGGDGATSLSRASVSGQYSHYTTTDITTLGAPVLLSRGRLFLRGPNGKRLTQKSGISKYKATWNGDRAVAHRLVKRDDGDGLIVPGDTLYIATTESLSGYVYLNAQDQFDLWYENNHAGDEEWVISRVGSTSTAPIRLGESIRLESARQSRDQRKPMYLSAESDGQLGTRSAEDTSEKNLGVVWLTELDQ